MAFVYCAKCKNEYDNYESKCPYCGTPSPALANVKPMLLRVVFIGGVVAVALMVFGQYFPVEKWIADLITSSPREQNTSAQAPRAQSPTATGREVDRSQPILRDNAGEPVQSMTPSAPATNVVSTNAQILTSVQAVDLYISSLTSRLTQSSSPLRVTAAPLEKPKNTFTYTLSDQTTLVLVLDQQNRKIQSITLNDSDERSFVKRLGDARGAFFAAALPPNIDVQDMNAQLDYLQQLVGAARNNVASYKFEGRQLSARRDSNKRTISITLTL